MTIEKAIFLIGIYLGIILGLLVSSLFDSFKKNEFKKYLGDTKQLQEYYDWKKTKN